MGKLSENELKGNAQSDQDLGEVIGGVTRACACQGSELWHAIFEAR